MHEFTVNVTLTPTTTTDSTTVSLHNVSLVTLLGNFSDATTVATSVNGTTESGEYFFTKVVIKSQK